MSIVNFKFIVVSQAGGALYQMLRLCLSWLELGVVFCEALYQYYKVITSQLEQSNISSGRLSVYRCHNIILLDDTFYAA